MTTTAADVTAERAAAEALCLAADTWEHHDQTDDFPCSRCRQTAAVLAVGLAWIYDTEQPDGAIPDHHGYSAAIGERRYRFIGQGADNAPVVVVDVAHPRYEERGDDRVLLNPIGGRPEMDALGTALASLEHPVRRTWNGEAHHDSGSLGLAEPAHPSLVAALARYHAGCPAHRTVFCGGWQASKGEEDCTWHRDGAALVVQPAWPAT